jgi:type II secretory pathway component GspD/PulD (secretin)
MPAEWQCFRWAVLLALACTPGTMPVHAQKVQIEAESEPAISIPAEPAKTSPDGPATTSAAKPGTETPRPPGKPGDTPAKPEGLPGKPGESPGGPAEKSKPDEGVKPVVRPSKSAEPPDPKELKTRPDAAGKVRFNFNGQPWQPVLEWLAKISGMSLDWQDLPGDYLNLVTQQTYTLAEARDVINRHLLARGYTLLCQGEVLTVANLKKLDPSLVPRLRPEDLDQHEPHEFVKVSFPLASMLAQPAAEELKPMLSPNGKLTALTETNRLEAIDAVANLREIYAVLQDEQSGEGQPRNVREFRLRHARASEVHEMLMKLLGLETKTASPMMPQMGQNPEQAMMMARMQAERGEPQPSGHRGPQPVGGATKKPPVTLAVNERQNSILVHAGPDNMAIVAQVVEAVDVPADRQGSLLANINRMQVYRLTGVDPEPVVKTLRDIGGLDPATKLEVDKKNRAIIAYGTLADHVTIRALVDRLAGSERKFEVIRLRRLSADYVAGTIEFMLGSGSKKEKTRSSPFFGSWDSPRREPAEPGVKEFRVDADVENNRLLLWANDVELAEVQNLLVKLGEIRGKGGNADTTRIIDGGSEVAELLERIRRTWPSIGTNPLLVTPPDAGDEEKAVPAQSPAPKEEPSAPAPKTSERFLRPAILRVAEVPPNGEAIDVGAAVPPAAAPPSPRPVPGTAAPAQPKAAPVPTADAAAPQPAPAVKLGVAPGGKLIVSSQDTEALDRLEELAARLATPRKDYKIFRLKYAWAGGVAANLREYFQDDKKERTRPMPWWYYEFGAGDDKEEDDRRLSKRRKLKFISDADTNSILVEGADANQLRTIDDLIKLYDQPPPSDTQSVRKTEIFRLKHSKAKVVAEAVKEVYRDLLSANDKSLAGPNQQGRESPRPFMFSFSDTDNTEQKTPKFKGLLSIGVDELSNSLAVSAPAYLFEHVQKLIKELDEAALPDTTIRLVKPGPGISASRLKQSLDEALNEASAKKAAEKQPAQPAAKPKAKPSSRPAGVRSGTAK